MTTPTERKMPDPHGYWRNVWYVPPGLEGWRSRMEHLKNEEYLGTNEWPTREAAEERARSDEQMFASMVEDGCLNGGMKWLRAEFFPEALHA